MADFVWRSNKPPAYPLFVPRAEAVQVPGGVMTTGRRTTFREWGKRAPIPITLKLATAPRQPAATPSPYPEPQRTAPPQQAPAEAAAMPAQLSGEDPLVRAVLAQETAKSEHRAHRRQVDAARRAAERSRKGVD